MIIFRQNISVGYKQNGESGQAWTGDNLAVDLYMSEEAYKAQKEEVQKITNKLNQSFVDCESFDEAIKNVGNHYKKWKTVIHSLKRISVS